ncbi:hypothetical protein HLRTI_001406 [Halorhabdus tiamatea SARL4B]|uniref:Insertion element protein (MITEHsal3) n=2 Tax=Halobacteriales TaxID=2235 RepID=A0A4D6GW81_HALS9|nr:hypothetical protein HLRTI_001406 [Halorhabdus tiamatea SARL4B]QCC44567.1 insertion element protein (MITEHsal3) [Halobacterium salinarum]QCC46039.1 insertion element protein (MITEHsal3) [Halobacterium salinarum]
MAPFYCFSVPKSDADINRLGTQMMILGTQVSLLGLAIAHYFNPVVGLTVFASGFLGTIGVFMDTE